MAIYELPTKARVLIVDDDATARSTLAALLSSENYDLRMASSGQEVLAYLDELKPDTILMDVMMPDMDGWTVCQQLKAQKKWRHIPVILVTALDAKEDIVHGLEAGADEFLSKPVNGLELRARVRTMLRIKQQYDELEATLRLREDLASMIAHDMRNLLSPIMGYSQLLIIEASGNSDSIECAEAIYDQANRLSSFINDMLLLAKMEQGHLILNCTPTDINLLVQEIASLYQVVAVSKGITLTTDIPAESRQILLDTNLFRRLIDNLISNALKFSPKGSTVTLQVQYPPFGHIYSNGKFEDDTGSQTAQMQIKVLDEGPGIPIEYHERVFNKFETVSLKHTGVPQIGLGLAFCKMIAEAHKGRIFIEANQPRGTIFTVEI